jgi:hypothetical protein
LGVYRAGGEVMADRGRLRGVADEGGWWPEFASNAEALDTLVEAIDHATLRPGEEVGIAIDVAASQFYSSGRYRLAADGVELETEALVELLAGWCRRYPIVSVEDPVAEDDDQGMVSFTGKLGAFDLFAIVKQIVDAKAQFRSIAEPWADTGTSTGRLMLAVLGGLADVERDLIRTRTAEGRSRAKAQGQHMGRPPALPRRRRKRPPDAARRALRYKNWRTATLSAYLPFAAPHASHEQRADRSGG